MVTKLEKQFFDTFGIEPKIINTAVGRGFYIEHNRVEKYPQITDRILLELICILSQYEKLINISTNTQELKTNIINQIIGLYQTYDSAVCDKCDFQEVAELIKHQVRTLFEEG